jgi:hypothetical protein
MCGVSAASKVKVLGGREVGWRVRRGDEVKE